MTKTDALLSPLGGFSSAPALGVSKPSVRPFKGIPFLTPLPHSVAYKPSYDFIRVSLTGPAFIVERKVNGESYLSQMEFPTAVTLAYPLGQAGGGVEASGHRSRELEWRRSHGETLRAFVGQWLVLEGEEIIAYGDDPVRVISEAKMKGIQVPYLFCVEAPDEDVVRMGL